MKRRKIDVDEEVYEELGKRARPFEDTPNSVLRRLFGLTEVAEHSYNRSGIEEPLKRLLKLAGISESRVSPTISGRYMVKEVKRGTVASIRVQSRLKRLKIAAPAAKAEQAGAEPWDEERPEGWHKEKAAYWWVPFEDEEAYLKAAEVLKRLYLHGG
jgi:hypothetical protein